MDKAGVLGKTLYRRSITGTDVEAESWSDRHAKERMPRGAQLEIRYWLAENVLTGHARAQMDNRASKKSR